MKLYNINESILKLVYMYENEEIDEKTYSDTLESLKMEQSDKIDDIACYVKQLLAEEKALKEEIDNLAKRRKAKQKTIDNLKEYIITSMNINKLDRLETPRNIIKFRNNVVKVNIEDEEKFLLWAMENHDELLNYKKPEISKTALKEYLKYNEIEGVNLVREKSLQIK